MSCFQACIDVFVVLPGAGARGPAGYGAPFQQPGFAGPATPPAFNPYAGYPAPAPAAGYAGYPAAAAYGGYAGYPPQQPAYPQPQAANPAAAAGYPAYGAQPAADPYAASQQAAYGAQYGAAAPHAPATHWQELSDSEGRTYYYNTTTGTSQWEKPPELP